MKKIKTGFSLLAVSLTLLALTAPGCEAKETREKAGASAEALAEVSTEASGVYGNVLVTVNGEPITDEDVNTRLKGYRGKKITPRLREQTLKNLVEQELMYQRGLKLGFGDDPKYKETLRGMQQQARLYKRMRISGDVFQKEIKGGLDVSDKEVKKYYDKNTERIQTELKLAEIYVKDEEKAEQSLEKIKNGAPFEEIARERFPNFPKNPPENVKSFPWETGFLKWGKLPLYIEKEVYKLEKGGMSGIMGNERIGFRIFKLVDKRKNPGSDFEKMKESIKKKLLNKKILDSREKYIKNLEKDAKIVYQNE